MREILFRGKRIDNGAWEYGGLINADDGEARIATSYLTDSDITMPLTVCAYMVDPDTVGQFTGLLDKNGNKIFEGDILKDEFNNLWLVTYELGAFCISNGHSGGTMFEPYADDIQIGVVIGNKWDNPELLDP